MSVGTMFELPVGGTEFGVPWQTRLTKDGGIPAYDVLLFSSLPISKRIKKKTYIWVSVWWKTKTYNLRIYTSRIHWKDWTKKSEKTFSWNHFFSPQNVCDYQTNTPPLRCNPVILRQIRLPPYCLQSTVFTEDASFPPRNCQIHRINRYSGTEVLRVVILQGSEQSEQSCNFCCWKKEYVQARRCDLSTEISNILSERCSLATYEDCCCLLWGDTLWKNAAHSWYTVSFFLSNKKFALVRSAHNTVWSLKGRSLRGGVWEIEVLRCQDCRT
jgi:hypothetical protein